MDKGEKSNLIIDIILARNYTYVRFRIDIHAFGEVAQSVERETENLCVGGSIPSLATSTTPHKKVSLILIIFSCAEEFESAISGNVSVVNSSKSSHHQPRTNPFCYYKSFDRTGDEVWAVEF